MKINRILSIGFTGIAVVLGVSLIMEAGYSSMYSFLIGFIILSCLLVCGKDINFHKNISVINKPKGEGDMAKKEGSIDGVILTSILLLVVITLSMSYHSQSRGIQNENNNINTITIGDVTPDGDKVNINLATVDTLSNLPGIGETTAESIKKHIEEKGDIKNFTELVNIIGTNKAQKIKDMVEYDSE